MDNDLKVVYSLILGVGMLLMIFVVGGSIASRRQTERCKLLLEAQANPITVHSVCAAK